MTLYRVLAAYALAVAGSIALGLPAAAYTLVIDRGTGATYLKNESFGGILFDGYEVLSASGSLRPTQWITVAGNYDAAGNASIDLSANWIVLSQTSSSVAEASPSTLTANIFPGNFVFLGNLWTVGAAEDVTGAFSRASLPTTPLNVDFRSLAADYNDDLNVNQADYNIWASTYASSIDLRADGNGDGVVNAADYTVWRDSPELLPAISAASVVGFGIPEPATGLMAVLSATLATRRRR